MLIDTTHANAQSESPLFGLPAEVRLLILEFVIGTGTIHFNFRRCHDEDTYLPSASGLVPKELRGTSEDEMLGLRDPRGYEMVGEFNKMTYTICKRSHDWERAYALSKSPIEIPDSCLGDDGQIRWDGPSDKVMTRYWARHRECFLPIYDLERRSYTMICRDGSVHTSPAECEDCFCRTRRIELKRIHGLDVFTPVGLKKLHANTKLHLAVLQTCRLAYHEASLLPYQLLTFDVQSACVAQKLAQDVLTSTQAGAIEKVHISDTFSRAGDYLNLLRAFPGMKQLQHSRDYEDPREDNPKIWRQFFRRKRRSQLQHVEVLIGWEEDNCIDYRATLRSASDDLEKYLNSRFYAEAEASQASCGHDDNVIRQLCAKENKLHGTESETDEPFRRGRRHPNATLRDIDNSQFDGIHYELFSDSDHELNEHDDHGWLQRRYRKNFRRFNDEMARRCELREYLPTYARPEMEKRYHNTVRVLDH